MSEPPERSRPHGSTVTNLAAQRFHPYNHRPPTNNGRQGVENPGGYLTGAPMEFPEPSSGGPAAGWLGHDGRIAFPNDASAMRTSNIPPHTIDSIATDVQLSGDQRMALHRFTKGGAEVQQAQVHAHQLALENKITSLQDTIKDVKEATDKVSKTVTSSWTPNDFQKKTVRQLCWNYLTYDLDSYLLLWINVKESVGVNPTKVLSVPTYGTDLELTKAVDSFIRSEANNVKSRFKKAMDNEAGSQHSLTRITESTLKAHRQNWTPSSVVNDTHKALFANYRDVALRLLQKSQGSNTTAQEVPTAESSSESKGRTLRADSGFWKLLDQETGKRLETLGSNRANEKRVEWRRYIIEQDELRYGTTAPGSSALDFALRESNEGYLQRAST